MSGRAEHTPLERSLGRSTPTGSAVCTDAGTVAWQQATEPRISSSPTVTHRARLAVYVCADPGVPVFGTKGSSIHVQSVLAELVRRTDEVHLVTLRRGGEPGPMLAGVHVHEIPRPTGRRAEREAALVAADHAVAGHVEAIVGTRRPDVVYQRYSLWSCATMELAAFRGWPSVIEVNAPLVDEQARHRGLADRAGAEQRTVRAVTAATLPIAVSIDVGAWVEHLTGRRTLIVPNGVDPTRFTPAAASPRPPLAARADGRVVLGFVGTYKPWHDLDAIVATVEHLGRLRHRGTVPPVRLLLVGDGPELPGLLARLDALRADVPVEAAGAVAADRVPALLAGVDIALAPYGTAEQYFSPLKVFEYLAAGTAVVASRIRGLEGVLCEREAVLVAPGDREGFAGSVARLCGDPDARRSLTAAGRRAAVDRFGWDRTVERILVELSMRASR